jgi:membrane protein implicated in regulation of membrane protease activity
MAPVIDFFLGLGAWNWFIIAAAMGLLETIVPGVHFMWFGMAAVAMGGIVLALPLSLPAQLVAFAILSLGLILVARRYWAPQSMKTDAPDLNDRGRQYVGRIVTVAEAIERGRGKVQVGDTVWTAEGPDMPEGARAKVTGVNGTVLIVGAG